MGQKLKGWPWGIRPKSRFFFGLDAIRLASMNIGRSFLCRAAVLVAAPDLLSVLLAGCGPKEPQKPPLAAATNQTSAAPDPNSLDRDLVLSERDAAMLKGSTTGGQPGGTDADRAWEELATALQPPSEPAEWLLNEPSKEEVAAFQKANGFLAAMAADKAK